MQNSFYFWLVLLMAFSTFLGAALARLASGATGWYDVAMSALFCILAAAALSSIYRDSRKDSDE